ncbi:MAG: right-handed parallel beta-helix repeat-containing protein [Myxococcales bacterium]|nr:right-handed parallel beta-helix repeat-containing protein [Myxococcales bacterium]MCB9751996.1 right-handed parallel beta-helix repeat-containing protein [Myxococcales bacterium]
MNYRLTSLRTLSHGLLLALPLAACSGGGDGTETDADATSEGTGTSGGATEDPTASTTAGGNTDGATDSESGTGSSGSTGDTGDDANFPNCSCADFEGDCIEVTADDEEGLQIAANSLEDNGTLVLGLGSFELDNQVTIRADGITVCGQGIGVEGDFEQGTTLDFAAQMTQSNGLDIVGDNTTVRDLAIVDAKKDGLRIEDSDDVTIQRVRVTWRKVADSSNGSYGIYPVKVRRVLIEDSVSYNSSDAGIYVGQCAHAIVRNNVAKRNVAGIEIENTQYADVYGNLAEDNTGGLLIFDLPGNPIVGHDISIHDNTIINNNQVNFAPGGTVKQIPPGTGTFAMASRRVEIFDNTYENNGTGDIAVVSGLIIEGDEEQWAISLDELNGDIDKVELPMGDGVIYNYQTNNIFIHDNSHSGSGMDPFKSTMDQEFGALLILLYADNLPIDNVLYDTIGESSHHPTDAAMNSNDNHLCLQSNTGATFVSLNAEETQQPPFDIEALFRPPAPFTPFDCGNFTMGPITPPDMG